MRRFPAGRGRWADLPITDLLNDLALTGSLTQTCRNLDLCHRTVLRHVAARPDFAARVDAARKAGREANFVHGSPSGARRCGCEVCAFAYTVRMDTYRVKASGQPCPECGRIIGSRGGKRYAHHSDPGVICPGSESASGRLPALSP